MGGTNVYPDVIRPFLQEDVFLPPNGNKCLWVTIEPINSLPIGEHKINFQLYSNENVLLKQTEYLLNVLDADMVSSDIIKTNWMHYDGICLKHNVNPFSKQFYKVFENYLNAYTRAGFNTLLTPLFTPALDTCVGGERLTTQLVKVSCVNGAYKFNFSKLKAFLNFVLARGIKYIEFSHLFTQWGGEHCPKIMAYKNGKQEQIFGWESNSIGNEYVQFLTEFLSKLTLFIKKENLQEKCFFHLTDEPNEKHVERYTHLRKIVKDVIKDIPTIDALSHYEYYEKGLVDIPVPSVSSVNAFLKNKVCNALVYHCCEQTREYYSNRFLNMPLQRTRILGCQLYQTGMRGFLHWGFNFYNTALSYRTINPYTETSAGGAFPPGDAFIVYPSENGVNISMRLENIAMGFEDYDLLYTLEQKIGREKVLELLESQGVKDFKVYPRDSVWHTCFINQIKLKIAE